VTVNNPIDGLIKASERFGSADRNVGEVLQMVEDLSVTGSSSMLHSSDTSEIKACTKLLVAFSSRKVCDAQSWGGRNCMRL
jgi:hypothetical protein